ncbi:hypothetical protein Pcinc_037609 [Petrolisthes cinctipes]|uniref:Uncharacterized protein n=1 Tax=Petrolisthes cinctipes TaxID=88211 RepID=A0AAE1BSI4_PETCI|nr:hypothetical protein Pcinc_037609 [Petrolisthes cinctipes]
MSPDYWRLDPGVAPGAEAASGVTTVCVWNPANDTVLNLASTRFYHRTNCHLVCKVHHGGKSLLCAMVPSLSLLQAHQHGACSPLGPCNLQQELHLQPRPPFRFTKVTSRPAGKVKTSEIRRNSEKPEPLT